MIPIEHIRNNPEEVAQKLTSKGENPAIEGILKLDEKYRTDLGQANDLRAKRNKASDAIAKAKRSGENADDAINSMREVSQHIKVLEEKTQESKTKLDELLLGLPNLPHESVPAGKDEKDNPLVREWGESTEYDFELKNHLELGEALGLFDFERGAKIAGSGFPLYTGRGAKLERALINYMLDVQTDQHGYTEIFPPFLVRSESAITTGQLPKFSEDMYFSEKDGLWLIPTAEVPLTNIHKDEILNEDQIKKIEEFSNDSETVETVIALVDWVSDVVLDTIDLDNDGFITEEELDVCVTKYCLCKGHCGQDSEGCSCYQTNGCCHCYQSLVKSFSSCWSTFFLKCLCCAGNKKKVEID